MSAGEVWGTALEKRLVRRNQELRDRVTGAERIRVVQEMEKIRKEIAQGYIEKNMWRLH
jgi:hypothetical protein